jgi:Putative Actinobacterial Holin-X, holin superfamily III
MALQKIVNGARSSMGAQPNGLIEEISSFGADLASLAVLQARLAACDVRDGVKRTRFALVVMAICGMVSGAGIVAIIIGSALWLAARFQLDLGVVMILLGTASLLVAGSVSYACVRAVAAKESVFQRSHEELERNLAWIRTTLAQSGR